MASNIFFRKDFLKEAGITEKALVELETNNLLKPVGTTEDKLPFYTNSSIEQLHMVVSLKNVGYSLPEIQKIIKKVGLPNNTNILQEEKKLAQYITISNLANKVGVSPRTIKHWEEKGIIESEMRSSGGFRLYSEVYVYMCQLIRDLQLFNYSLEEIKVISDFFRDFLLIGKNPTHYSQKETEVRLEAMNEAIIQLFAKMNLLKEGISRWESLLKAKQKEIKNTQNKNTKRSSKQKPAKKG